MFISIYVVLFCLTLSILALYTHAETSVNDIDGDDMIIDNDKKLLTSLSAFNCLWTTSDLMFNLTGMALPKGHVYRIEGSMNDTYELNICNYPDSSSACTSKLGVVCVYNETGSFVSAIATSHPQPTFEFFEDWDHYAGMSLLFKGGMWDGEDVETRLDFECDPAGIVNSTSIVSVAFNSSKTPQFVIVISSAFACPLNFTENPCIGVTCDNAPLCHYTPGTCVSGACKYVPQPAGTSCVPISPQPNTNYQCDQRGICVPQASPSSDTHVSAGTIFIIILIVTAVLYACFGCVCNSAASGTMGMENCPHRQFWQDLPNLVIDGVRFTRKLLCCQLSQAKHTNGEYETIIK